MLNSDKIVISHKEINFMWLDFFTITQMMSFSVRIPLSWLFSCISRLPTRFLTMVLAHSLRSVSGVT